MNQVDDYIFNQNEELRELLITLRTIILKSDSKITEKISYKIPFFSRNKPFCYLNPKKLGVDIGFWGGTQFERNAHLLELKDRKMIKTYFISFDEEINIDHLNSILQEAIEIDNSYAIKKKG